MGRVLTIVYAFIGIPLVLAILSQFGKLLTTWTSDLWMKYDTEAFDRNLTIILDIDRG